jgi:hypothetical protein
MAATCSPSTAEETVDIPSDKQLNSIMLIIPLPLSSHNDYDTLRDLYLPLAPGALIINSRLGMS